VPSWPGPSAVTRSRPARCSPARTRPPPAGGRAAAGAPPPPGANPAPARRRFTPEELLALLAGAGLEPGEWRGVSVVTDLLGAASDADPDALRALELSLASSSPYRDVATALHLLATRQ
jgi:S-adenosylmethionine-dependent methyltransferase